MNLYNDIFLILFSIIGLCLGSFYNVVILRSLTGESIVFPGSKCPKCQNKLKPWHNIPVLSYIFLRGKCAYCKEKISIQYPLIELTTMGIFAFSYIKFGLEWKTLFAIIVASTLLIMSMTDLKEKVVECNIAIGLAITGFIYNWFVNNTFLDSLYGLIIAVLVMEILAATGHLLKKGRAFGEADTYVAGALGACFGLNSLLTILTYTLISAALFTIPIFLYKQFKNNNKSVCILSIVFILTTLIYKNVAINWITFSILIISGILL
ncbi:MAG: prepilin peptidase, partial [Clostridia bacterium]|nr:prepilin peptidase [Clostridia bacterium]